MAGEEEEEEEEESGGWEQPRKIRVVDGASSSGLSPGHAVLKHAAPSPPTRRQHRGLFVV